MSDVTNILLSFDICEEEDDPGDVMGETSDYTMLTQINAWLAPRYGAFGVDADWIAGGTKHLEAPLYIAAFNHFDLDAFCAFLRTLPWLYPQHVQLFVQEENDNCWRLLTPCWPVASCP